MKPVIPLFSTVILLCLSVIVIAETGSSGVSLDNLRIRKQIAGWREDKGSFMKFGPEKLFELINGGAPEYIDRGMVRGFVQRLSGPGSASVELFTEDFGSHENAGEMVQIKKQDRDTLISLPDFDTATVAVIPLIGAFVVYGAIDRYYFEITLSGLGSSGSEALTELKKFFLFYRGVFE
ncbi:MAG: hypothetical protein JW863_10610 [Chitinispirillaceae bacterium]|nr:hypothetical protein [Chitinispirillaceae bacterium]